MISSSYVFINCFRLEVKYHHKAADDARPPAVAAKAPCVSSCFLLEDIYTLVYGICFIVYSGHTGQPLLLLS